jgi:hypothetical protein
VKPERRWIRPVRRGGLAALGLVELSWGGWAYLAPAEFFTDFPGFGHRWTAAYPPYNQHLTADLGATFLTFGALLVLAAALDDTRVTAVALAGAMLFNLLHLVFHATHHGTMTGTDYPLSLLALLFGVLVPAALLALLPRHRHPAG